MNLTQRNLYLILIFLGVVLLAGCIFLVSYGLLLQNRLGRVGLVLPSPTQTSQITAPNSFQFLNPQSGTPGVIPPTPTFASQIEPPTPSPEPLRTPASASTWQQGKIVFPYRLNRLNALYWLDLGSSGSPTALLDNPGGLLLTAPVLSPDGSKVAFNYYLGDMFVFDFGNPQPVRLGYCGAPSWSPDGSQMICKSSQPASFDILEVQTGELVRSIATAPSALFPTWSPAGGEIAFVKRDSQGSTSIWRMSLADGGAPVLLSGETGENYAPAWSPDGQWIAFQSNLGSTQSEIWVMDRSGANARQVGNTPAESWSRAPAWSPDGQWLAFVSDQAGSSGSDYGEVFVASLATGETIQVTRTGGNVYDWRVSWSR